MKTVVWNTLSEAERRAALARPAQRSDAALQASVRAIVDDVRARVRTAIAARGREARAAAQLELALRHFSEMAEQLDAVLTEGDDQASGSTRRTTP